METLERFLLLLVSLSALNKYCTQGCEYSYVRQPPAELSCNPYEATRLALICSAEGPTTPRFSIAWFRKINGRADQEELQVSQLKINVEVSETSDSGGTAQFTRRSSRLHVMSLDEMKDVGNYWCQVRLENGTLFQAKSNILTLGVVWEYNSFNRCSMSQYVEEENCIETVQVTESAVTADGNIPTDAGSIFLTVSSSDLSPTSSERSISNTDNLAALYAVVGIIAVFCVVIVTLSIIIVVLYRKKCGPVRFKTGDHKQAPNPYSGFTRERVNGNQGNIVSKGGGSNSGLASSGSHQQQNVGSPTLLGSPGYTEEEPYSRLMRDQLPQHGGVAEVLPGYSKLELQGAVPPLPPKPPSTKSKSGTPPPHAPLRSPPTAVAHNERQSQIYSDLTDKDLERGLQNNHLVPHVDIYNTLESNLEAPLSPGGNEYQELTPEQDKYDYGEEFSDWMVSNVHVAEAPKTFTQKSTLFDDPEYSPLRGISKKEDTILDSRYVGDYERSPTYTCPTMKIKANEIDPKYRSGYEWDPTYVPKRSPRRASCSSSGRRRIPKPDEVMKRRKSLEADTLHKYTGDYEWSPNYVPAPLRNESCGPLGALDQKYSGNYERDPVYMAHVLKKSAQEKQRAKSVEYTIPGTISRESSVPPHIPHEYTQLEENTMDPPRQYARLNSQTPEPTLES